MFINEKRVAVHTTYKRYHQGQGLYRQVRGIPEQFGRKISQDQWHLGVRVYSNTIRPGLSEYNVPDKRLGKLRAEEPNQTILLCDAVRSRQYDPNQDTHIEREADRFRLQEIF
jgi:hypothetical protein